MARFFIHHPIVAIVIAIVMIIVGAVALTTLPVAQFPDIVPPEVNITANYVGADALTVEQSVATPIEQQMSGVDGMNYMYSVNSNDGRMSLRVNFEVGTDPNNAQILAQMRQSQADPQLPQEVRNAGVTVQKAGASPMMVISLYSPDDSFDAVFLTNYARINLNDALLRVNGIGQVQVFGAGQYAMRLWVRPDTLARYNITVPEIIQAVQKQNAVNPAGQIGGEPVPAGQEFTYTVRAQGRLSDPAEFENIVVRANPDGSVVRVRDVARVELGAQTYNMVGRFQGRPAGVISVYQQPGSNAIQASDAVRAMMEEASLRFPEGLDYEISMDATAAVRAGMREIVSTLFEAIVLVLVVIYIFLQNFRATVIPMLTIPISLIATFAVFPLAGFSLNTLSLLALILAIGIVVDDAIVVVESTETHIADGLSPKEATLKAMEEVSGPIVATTLILVAVFVPTAFIPGITGRLYQQFAVTITISVIFSSINALSLSPALASLLLRPRKEGRGPLAAAFRGFNRAFDRATNGYTSVCKFLIRKTVIGLLLLAAFAGAAGWFGMSVPASFLPEEDQGYIFLNVSLPEAASMQRTEAVCAEVEKILAETPGVEFYTTVVGFSLLSGVSNTYSGFFFVNLADWEERQSPETQYKALMNRLNYRLFQMPEATAFAFSPPAIPGIGAAGGVTFLLEDRAGGDMQFLAEQMGVFMNAAMERPEIARIMPTLTPSVPQVFADVDRDRVLKLGVDLSQVYRTLQTFMGGSMINYFNRFGRQWPVYIQAEGEYRTQAENVGQFYVRNADGAPVPLSTLVQMTRTAGPEFTMRFNLFRTAQLNVSAAPGYSSGQAMAALEEVFAETMPPEMGYDYMGMSFQEKQAQEGVSPMAIFALSLLFVFLILAAQYESWGLPFAVLLGTPVAVFGAFAAIYFSGMENNVYVQIGLVMLIALGAKNAILIVEFAKAAADRGQAAMDAALEGARLRLRPILMTSLSFVLGCLPLVMAAGSGALARRGIGIAVVGGMLAASFLAIFMIPLTFYVVQKVSGADRGKVNPKPYQNPGA
jgi:HAE1 family hydrophobic/amphiphilic exporter-1